MDHCLNVIKEQRKEDAERIYVTDALKAIAENTARMANGSVMSKRYAELLPIPKKVEKKEQTAEDIIQQVHDRMARKK